MPQTPVNIGTTANDGTGDALRAAFGKLNNNDADHETRVRAIEAYLLAPETLPTSILRTLLGKLDKVANLSDLTDKAAALAQLGGAPLSSVVRTDVAQALDAAMRRRVKLSIGSLGTGYTFINTIQLDATYTGNMLYVSGGSTVTLPLLNTMFDGDAIELVGWDGSSTIVGAGSDAVVYDGTTATQITLLKGQSLQFRHAQGQWLLVGRHAPMRLFDDPWIAYTPTVAVQSGTLASYVAAGKYRKIGKTVDVSLSLLISDKGTASGLFSVSLPFAAANDIDPVLHGYEKISTGMAILGQVNAGEPVTYIRSYNGTSPLNSNYLLILNGTYETN